MQMTNIIMNFGTVATLQAGRCAKNNNLGSISIKLLWHKFTNTFCKLDLFIKGTIFFCLVK